MQLDEWIQVFYEEIKQTRKDGRSGHKALHKRIDGLIRIILGTVFAFISMLLGLLSYLIKNGVPWN